MSSLVIKPVRTRRERRLFLTFPWRIYRQDPLWVPPLYPERTAAIDPQRNVFFQRGEAEFYIAWRDNRPVGTICAAHDGPTNANRGTKECMFGFFEYVDDLQVARALVDTVSAWADARGLDTLFGPFNLDYENSYGVLLEGRDRPPALMCGHTPPYYRPTMEALNFEPSRGDNLAYSIEWRADSPKTKRLARLAEYARRRSDDVTIRDFNLDEMDREIDSIHRLLNIALAHLPDHIGWHRESVQAMLEPFRTIADPELVLFAEVDGEVVGWLPSVPNLNEAFIHVNGLRYPWNYAQLWWRMRRPFHSLTIKSVLVHPDYWGTGVPVLLLDEMSRRVLARDYDWLDLSITSADNPNTPLLAEQLGAHIYKRYRVYRRSV